MEKTSNSILNKITSSSNNIHQEFEFNKILISVVMIDVETNDLHEYKVFMICIDKVNKKTYHDIFIKEYSNKNDAFNYYNDLINRVKTTNEDVLFRSIKVTKSVEES